MIRYYWTAAIFLASAAVGPQGRAADHGSAEDRESPVIFRVCIAVPAEPSQELAS
jgi:hypothetical protein